MTENPRCKTCDRDIKALCLQCLVDGLGHSIEKQVVDGLRAAITDHGPITTFWIGSAAKRINSRIRAHARIQMERNKVGTEIRDAHG